MHGTTVLPAFAAQSAGASTFSRSVARARRLLELPGQTLCFSAPCEREEGDRDARCGAESPPKPTDQKGLAL